MKAFLYVLFSGMIWLAALESDAKPLEGYKDLKFGSSLKDVKEKLNCPDLQSYQLDAYPKVFKTYICTAFSFGGKNRVARIVTFEDKFLELLITDVESSVLDALKAKYSDFEGAAPEEIEGFQRGTMRAISAYFASRTIEFQMTRDGNLLFYRSPDFQSILQKAVSDTVSKDI
jgi:hypothetical protein